MASYPASAVVFPARSDGQTIYSQHINAIQDEIAAIEASLIAPGTLPSPQTIAGTAASRAALILTDPTTPIKHRHAIHSTVPSASFISANAFMDGAGAFNLDDVTQPGIVTQVYATGSQFSVFMLTAGANPRTVFSAFRVNADGSLTERGRAGALGGYQSYVPTWTATGTAPVLGNGGLTGAFAEIGNLVFFQIQLRFGTTTSVVAGTGSWLFSLPKALASPPTVNGAWAAWCFDNSASVTFPSSARSADPTHLVVQTSAGGAAGSAHIAGNAAPMLWAVNDVLEINGCYFQ